LLYQKSAYLVFSDGRFQGTSIARWRIVMSEWAQANVRQTIASALPMYDDA
jgi:hypothetical protein